MLPTGLRILVIAALFFLLNFSIFPTWSQQTSATPAGTEKIGDKNNSDAVAANVSESNQTHQDPELPSLPGADVHVLKEGEQVPHRADTQYEDWSRPELTPGMKSEVTFLGKSDRPGFTRELVSVQWREMDPIDLWIVKPTDVKNPPVILYLYSYPSTNERYKSDEICRFLTKNGFAAIGFVSAITGQRIHDRPKQDTFVTHLQEAIGSSVHNVQMILNYLATRGDLDMTRVGMWGDGSGASIAIISAAVDSRIKTLDLLNPWGDWPSWFAGSSLVPEAERARFREADFLKTVENLDPQKWLPQLKTQNIRLQHIMQGIKVTPDSVRVKMEAVAPSSAKIIHYDNTKAFINDVASTGKGFDWIKEQLASTTSGQKSQDESLSKIPTPNASSTR